MGSKIIQGSLLLPFFLSLSLVAHAMVYDGGSFSQDKVTTHTDFGSSGPEPMPTNLAYDMDRYSNAPVGVALYVLGSDSKCYRGNFSYSKYEKVLIFYSKSQVNARYCIYQRSFASPAQGFAISTRDGGVCVAATAGDDASDSFIHESAGGAVPFSDCVANTVSYGEYVEKNKIDVRSVAATTDKPADNSAMTPSVAVSGASNNEPNPNGETVPEQKTVAVAGAQPDRADLPLWVTTAREIQNPSEGTKVAMGGADGASQAMDPPPVRTPVKSKPVMSGGFTLQISSHDSADAAEAKVKALKEKGLSAFVITGSVKGATWYRVCAGRYETMKAARAAKKSFEEKNGLEGTFVQKIPQEESADAN